MRDDPATGSTGPVMDAELQERLISNRMAGRRLSTVCTIVAMTPFMLPFVIAGLAVGLAGCPMSWNSSRPPACEFAGINWGPLMAGAFDLMFTAVPIGIGAAVVIFLVGQIWLASRGLRHHGRISPWQK